jgi:hypothetical protein
MKKLSQIWFEVQQVLFPFMEQRIEESLTEKLKLILPQYCGNIVEPLILKKSVLN